MAIKHKYSEGGHWWAGVLSQMKTTSRCCRPPWPISRREGPVLPPDFNPTSSTRMSLSQGAGIVCGALGKPQACFTMMTCSPTHRWAAGEVLCELEQGFLRPPPGASLWPVHVWVCSERGLQLTVPGLRGWVCLTLHVCVCVSVPLAMSIPCSSCKMILSRLGPTTVVL